MSRRKATSCSLFFDFTWGMGVKGRTARWYSRGPLPRNLKHLDRVQGIFLGRANRAPRLIPQHPSEAIAVAPPILRSYSGNGSRASEVRNETVDAFNTRSKLRQAEAPCRNLVQLRGPLRLR